MTPQPIPITRHITHNTSPSFGYKSGDMNLQDKIEKILNLLSNAYGRPKAFRRAKAIDVLIRTVLSQNTTDKNSVPAFIDLKRKFKPWDKILGADVKEIASLIKHAGLANIKARRIKDILTEISRREGTITLSALKKLSIEDSLDYLKSLKGVGPKTAACVLLFGFGKPVMPVDTHIFRVTKRLGLIDKSLRIEEAHETLSRIIPKDLIYEFHLDIIEHGRRVCKAQRPRCRICAVYGFCGFKDKEFYKRKQLNYNRQ